MEATGRIAPLNRERHRAGAGEDVGSGRMGGVQRGAQLRSEGGGQEQVPGLAYLFRTSEGFFP